MTVRLLPGAKSDLDEVVARYEREEPGLGVKFANQFADTLQMIVRYPNVGAPFARKNRRCPIHGFPYGVLYRVFRAEVVVGAVRHLHRAPGAWLERLLSDE
ncbi:MAG: type II toxin-antitoxin system RelE/ParE family toxin [Planctomycetes bacterium]|nr:type II toxin-antitoxin system RelE/ParE family toxin [Planctomycetota bacterium]